MKGGTLLVSRAVKLHADHKKRLEELGFKDVSVTSADKDGLNMLINELKPRLVIVGSGFYKSATPYMMSLLKRHFKDLNIAAVSINDYPADLAMKFVINGINSYVNYFDGISQFYKGLDCMREGKQFISSSVQECIDNRRELPPVSGELTERQIEVLRLLCNGFTTVEIADELFISKRTVEYHKAELFNSFGTRNENELIRVALYLGLIKIDELDFYGGSFTLRLKNSKRTEKGGLYKN
jgi:two-component system, NarL family, response regulator NreC